MQERENRPKITQHQVSADVWRQQQESPGSLVEVAKGGLLLLLMTISSVYQSQARCYN